MTVAAVQERRLSVMQAVPPVHPGIASSPSAAAAPSFTASHLH
ncbi:hypothetical protein FM112_06415 [Gulosibacter sp. 10]|nr:hypothetical protein FM112_06415 [Gulosibacter sp. 10]